MKAILTLLFTVTFVVSPAFTEPFMGYEADQLPIPQIDPPVQPAGTAFAIWGLIYGWLIVSAVFGVWQRRDDAGWEAVRVPLLAALILGTPWLAVANASPIWATVLIFAMAGSAIAALWRTPSRDIWWLRVPVAIFAGWLSAASFVSLGSTLAGYGIAFDALGWAYACIGMAVVLTVAVQWGVPRAPAYGVTVIWALSWIAAKAGAFESGVGYAALAGIVVVLGAVALAWRRGAVA